MEENTENRCRISETLDIFHAWGVPVGKMTKKAKRECVKRIRSELKELMEAIDASDPVEELDALCDLIVISADYAHRAGYDLEAGMDLVNLSNSTKTLWDDELDNCEDSIKALEEKGKKGLKVIQADHGELGRSGCIVDETMKVQKPLKFTEPMLGLLFEENNSG